MRTLPKMIVNGVSSLLCLLAFSALAKLENFKHGPLISGYGKHHPVANITFDPNTQFRVAFDVAKGADAGEINHKFDSLARFLNMHVAAGVNPQNIQLALVIHGKASIDMLTNETYRKVHQQDNPNLALLNILMKHNVKVMLCGQSAAAYEIAQNQLVDGATMKLSAMTAHAQLQQLGYTMNPF